MPLDSGHRRQFCKVLKTHFPDTQFITAVLVDGHKDAAVSLPLAFGKAALLFFSPRQISFLTN